MLDQSYFFRSGGYPYFRKQPNSRLRPEKGLRQAPASRPHLLRLSELLGVTQPLKEEVAVWGPTQKSVTSCVEKGYQEGADAAIENLQVGFFT